MKRTSETNNQIEEIHENCIDISGRQIYLHDSVKEDAEDGIDFRVASRFMKNLSILEKSPGDIIIHLYSAGGQFDAGVLIYDVISASCCPVTIVCHGAVMSISTVILQAADHRLAMPNCSFMFHEGSEGIDGTHKQSKSWAEACKKQRDWMISLYAEKCQNGEFFKGKSVGKIKQYISSCFDRKEDWYLNSEEALTYGFIDRVVEPHGLVKLVQRS